MIQIHSKSDCCGCSACASVCAHGAIQMQPDALGFLYPVVDATRCVDCGLCDQVCAFHDHYATDANYPLPRVLAVRHRCDAEIDTSRSGAMFTALTDYIFQQGGVVYGAGYTDHFRVVHKRVTNKQECFELKGSKYVQSDIRGIFKSVRQDLKEGKIVLFSGTPCQTSGLRSYLPSKYQTHLYVCDIVCHGTPSPFVWRDYLQYQESQMKSTAVQVNFRDKAKGWRAHIESFVFQNGKKVYSDIYTFLFYKHIMFRPSCSVCHFTNLKRPSDITLADFWGWQKVDPQFNADDRGCSLVLINTPKGAELFSHVEDQLHYLETDTEKCWQPNLQAPSMFSPAYEQFCTDYASHGFLYVLKKYGNTGLICRTKRFVKRILKKWLRR